MLLHLLRSKWRVIREEIATVDWPTASLGYDPPDVVTDRTVVKLLDTLDAALPVISVGYNSGLNNLEFRAHFNDNAGTATMQIFAARKDELEVKMVAEVAWVAGTQTTGAGTARYFAKTASTSSTAYWLKTITTTTEETGTGIATVSFDTCGYDRFWVGFDAVKGSDNVTVEYSGW